MIVWLVEIATEHPVVAVVTAVITGLGSLLAGVAAVIDARTARNEAAILRAQVIDLDKRVATLEHK